MASATSSTNSKRDTARHINFVGMVRRLFCSTSIPTHPSSSSSSSSSSSHTHTMYNDVPPKPGLMARLMGLESMPRSRSMNSVEFDNFNNCDPKKHRRVKTSVSFQELPMYLEQEDNDEFFVISFERSNVTKKLSELTNDNLTTKRKIKDKEKTRKNVSSEKGNMIYTPGYDISSQFVDNQNQCGVNSSTRDHTVNQKEGISLTRKMKNHGHYIDMNGSEDSSPVSVFNFEEFLFDLEDAPIISDADPRIKNSKLSLEVEDYDQQTSNSRLKLKESRTELEDHDQPTSNSRLKLKESRTKDLDAPNKKKIVNYKWKQISQIAYEEDITETNWRYKDIGKLQVTEDITVRFEIEILHHLLNEMVQQLLTDANLELL